MIKALRIRNLQQLMQQQVCDSITSEFIGIFNYAIIGLIQLALGEPAIDEVSYEVANDLYHKYLNEAKVTMLQKKPRLR